MSRCIERPVNITVVNVLESGEGAFFTKEKARKWRDDLLEVCDDIILRIDEKIDPKAPVSFFVNKSLVDEVLLDAIIGMKKVIGSDVHLVDEPNYFKIAAYLGYWWLRHKPVSVHYPHENGFVLEDTQIIDDNYENLEDERLKFIWKLKYINEVIAAQLVLLYIFDFETPLCGPKQCKKVKKEDSNFCFNSFDEMKDTIVDKLLYYFAYRPIAPKIIEHTLEAYTLHPAWRQTGRLWATEANENE